MNKADAFFEERKRLNELVLKHAPLSIKRFFALDQDVYGDGAIPKKYKELLGLVASFVLRCDDCIAYHVARAQEEGASREEIAEALAIGLVVGGSITIPHLRRVFQGMEERDEGS